MYPAKSAVPPWFATPTSTGEDQRKSSISKCWTGKPRPSHLSRALQMKRARGLWDTTTGAL